MLASVNGFLAFNGLSDLRVKQLKIQKSQFRDESRNITKDEYFRLVQLAEQRNHRLSLVLQTICSTGIRISELKFVTVEAVNRGFADVNNKGKSRKIFLPTKLCEALKDYISHENRISGAVFVTRSGKPLDRSNVWREMKSLCREANIDESKVFPHNFRHLFAQEHYEKFHDLSRLCDILGHSSISTTRIYTADTGAEHARQLDSMDLVVNLQHSDNYVVINPPYFDNFRIQCK
jgi:site-specific recombinase XerD